MHFDSRRTVHLIVLALAIILLTGCSNDKNDTSVSGLRGVSSGQADQLNADRSSAKFDSVRDPPLTAETHFAAGQLADAQNA
jgi:hypothetical protein